MTHADVRDELREAVRRAVERADGPRPYLVGEPGTAEAFDTKLWRVLATEVGVAGLAVPAELGGAGGTVADVAVVAEELGGGLAPVPFFSTVALATGALLVHGGDPLARRLLTSIASGETTVTVAFCGESGSWAPGSAEVRAERVAEGWRLTGRFAFVVDGAAADVLLVAAGTDTGTALFAVEGTAGVCRIACQTLDLTRPLATVALDHATAAIIGEPGARLDTALDLALVLLATEQVGGAQRCLDDAITYAKQRVQFDRPIGGFQAVKHAMVDVLLAVELARSAAEVAVAAADAYLAAPDAASAAALAQAASLAKATCSEAYSHAAEETLHVHGGIGFTWEHDAHLHYRRARASELFCGTPASHRDRLARAAGL